MTPRDLPFYKVALSIKQVYIFFYYPLASVAGQGGEERRGEGRYIFRSSIVANKGGNVRL